MGLPRAGKTTLTNKIHDRTGWKIFNGDNIRSVFEDFDFTAEGRERQAYRMSELAKFYQPNEVVLFDFICPTARTREIFQPDFLVYVDIPNECPYEDTKIMFEAPWRSEWDVRVLSYDDSWVDLIINKINEKLHGN